MVMKNDVVDAINNRVSVVNGSWDDFLAAQAVSGFGYMTIAHSEDKKIIRICLGAERGKHGVMEAINYDITLVMK